MSKPRLCKICMRVHPKEINCNDVKVTDQVHTDADRTKIHIRNTSVNNQDPKVQVKDNGGGAL